ncbi:MAG: pantoate--beta-alanine ligase [Tissierellia bacterium]|nr:pantoate--beta-alanine ligase [Tissierellia bacterium]
MLLRNLEELNRTLSALDKGASIGLVPTMGFLHNGHLSLIERARKENDIVILSVFLNPTQFAPGEDLDSYPKDLERDVNLAKEKGVDYIFAPTPEIMYPDGFSTYVEVQGAYTEVLCGRSRPTHFKGVTTVLTKLFNLTRANRAYFGMKDAQQLSVVKKMVLDMNIPIEIVPCPIIRDEDGLALSSRNTYLNDEERKQALILNQTIREAKQLVLDGERDVNTIVTFVKEKINTMPLADIDYVEIVDFNTMRDINKVSEGSLLALAVRFGSTRLLDNTILL